jgi:PTS system ascorbate-specific IIA component
MTIKELLIEADAIQVGVVESDWQRVIKLAARPLEAKGFISTEYSQAVIDNTLNHGAYYVFDEGIAIPHARPECGVRRNCFSLVLLEKPIPLRTVKKRTLSLCLAPGTAMRISRRDPLHRRAAG